MSAHLLTLLPSHISSGNKVSFDSSFDLNDEKEFPPLIKNSDPHQEDQPEWDPKKTTEVIETNKKLKAPPKWEDAEQTNHLINSIRDSNIERPSQLISTVQAPQKSVSSKPRNETKYLRMLEVGERVSDFSWKRECPTEFPNISIRRITKSNY